MCKKDARALFQKRGLMMLPRLIVKWPYLNPSSQPATEVGVDRALLFGMCPLAMPPCRLAQPNPRTRRKFEIMFGQGGG